MLGLKQVYHVDTSNSKAFDSQMCHFSNTEGVMVKGPIVTLNSPPDLMVNGGLQNDIICGAD